MESDKDFKNKFQVMFIVLSSVVAVATLWNIREHHKIRKLQKKELENKLTMEGININN